MRMFPIALLAALAVSAAPAGAQTSAPKLAYVGEMVLPTGLAIGGVEFGGISGLDYDPAADVFYAVSDDRAEHGPVRFYTLKIAIDAKGIAKLDVAGMTPLTDKNGEPFAQRGIDPESIRYDPDRKALVWSSESDAKGVPSIWESGLDGHFQREFQLPAYEIPSADGTQGIYANTGPEGIALSSGPDTLAAITENGLVQDGPKTSVEAGSRSRLTLFDRATGKPRAEYVYVTEPIFARPTALPPHADSGVSELLRFDATHYLAMERAYVSGVGNRIGLFLVSLDGASDVLGHAELKDVPDLKPMTKQRLLEFKEGDFGVDVDNIEGISFGPELDGKRTLILVSDNNFNRKGEFTQFVLFTVE